ncbi:head GIN domain-containing protein [Sphingomonas sp. CCH5-D11]|uniref:head GIN domain-containing protein n=1 Tax=Sphingomonas sp. CCH5-D11 TaxID=1768786 RepID=UPI00082F6524|nr:head GIN domain-containing protein [Sphingomonas sp. CCH5-D11]
MRGSALALLIPLAACGVWSGDDDTPGVAGTGSGNERSYAVADFSSIDQRGPDDVDVRVGTGFSVRAEGEPDVLSRVKIAKDGDRLLITRQGSGINWSSGSVKIYVTMPRIEAARLAGSGDIAVDRIEGAKFDGSIAGSGTLDLGRVGVDQLELSIAGSGSAKAAGEADALAVNIAGSGDVEAAGLRAASADVNIAGAGNVRAVVNGPAKVAIMGAGDVDLGPQAKCEITKVGAGDVRCGG